MTRRGFAAPFVLIGILLLLLIVGGAYYLGKSSLPAGAPLPSPASTAISTPTPSTTDPTANWKTYTNSENGYTIKYPNDLFVRLVCPKEELDLTLRNPNDKREEIQADSCGRDVRYTVEMHTYAKRPEEPQSDKDYHIDKEEITIGGIKADKYVYTLINRGTTAPFSSWFESVLVTRGDKSYGIYLGNIKLQDTFDQILSTFKFTK